MPSLKKLVLLSATVSTLIIAGGNMSKIAEVAAETPVVDHYGDYYMGIAYSYLNTSVDNYNVAPDGQVVPTADFKLDANAVMLNAGYRFHEYIAVEGRYWNGRGMDVSTDQDSLDIDVNAFGLYAKPMYPVTDALDIYILLGYGYATLDESIPFFSPDGSVEIYGFSWGLGASYLLTENLSVFTDYVEIGRKDQPHPVAGVIDTEFLLESWNFGLAYKF